MLSVGAFVRTDRSAKLRRRAAPADARAAREAARAGAAAFAAICRVRLGVDALTAAERQAGGATARAMLADEAGTAEVAALSAVGDVRHGIDARATARDGTGVTPAIEAPLRIIASIQRRERRVLVREAAAIEAGRDGDRGVPAARCEPSKKRQRRAKPKFSKPSLHVNAISVRSRCLAH